ncbi:hypothetical protein COOONC_25792 [Cooperia oncophora]
MPTQGLKSSSVRQCSSDDDCQQHWKAEGLCDILNAFRNAEEILRTGYIGANAYETRENLKTLLQYFNAE